MIDYRESACRGKSAVDVRMQPVTADALPLMCIQKVLPYLIEDIMEASILTDAGCHLGPHASGQLIHERQKLVGGDLLHPFLEEKHTGTVLPFLQATFLSQTQQQN